MSGNDRLDLSPLDPAADAARWRAVMDATLERVEVVLRARRADPLTLIASWSRPLLVSAGVAAAVLVPVQVALDARDRREEQVRALVDLSVVVDHADTPPSGADFRRALAEGIRQ